MSPHTIKTTCKVTTWDEDRSITTVPRVTPASFETNLPEVKGTSKCTCLMIYITDGNTTYTYAESLKVEDFAGKKGDFVIMGTGTYLTETHQVKGEFEVVAGTAQGELAGIKGKGSFVSRKDDHQTVDYVFEVEV